MAKKKTQEQFEKEVHEKYPQIQIRGKYINTSTKIDCECTIDKYCWSATPSNILRYGCSVCNGHYMNDYTFKKKMKEINKNVEVIGTYTDRETPVECRCLICGNIFMGNVGSLLNGSTHKDCRSTLVSLKKTKDTEWFIKQLNLKYPNEYDVLGEYIKKKFPIKIRHKACGYEWETTPDNLLNSRKTHATCPKCSKLCRISDDKYKQILKVQNPNVIPLEKYINSDTKILHKCLVCNYEWKAEPGSIIHANRGCPICNGGTDTIVRGINDMWTTNPELASLLADPEDGYRYTQGTSKKVCFKCNNCGSISKPLSIHKVKTRGFNCKCCSENRSFPNKIMYNLLSYLNIPFEDEKKFDWCKFKVKGKNKYGIYDFYIKDNNIIIEMDGRFHYEYNNLSNQTLKTSQIIDYEKDKLAYEHNIKVIRIDCYVSDINYIKEHILQSELNGYFDLSDIDWNYCFYHTIPNYIKEIWNEYNNKISIMDLARKYKKDYGTISKYLKMGNSLGLCNYTVDGYHTEVICLDTLKVYDKIADAIRETGVNNISNACRSKTHIAGKSLNGQLLHWMYYEEYKENYGEVS